MKRPDMTIYISAYMRHLPSMLAEHEGKWTVFKGNEPLGFYNSRNETYAAGLEAYGNVDMLVRQISIEYVIYGPYGKPKEIGEKTAALIDWDKVRKQEISDKFSIN